MRRAPEEAPRREYYRYFVTPGLCTGGSSVEGAIFIRVWRSGLYGSAAMPYSSPRRKQGTVRRAWAFRSRATACLSGPSSVAPFAFTIRTAGLRKSALSRAQRTLVVTPDRRAIEISLSRSLKEPQSGLNFGVSPPNADCGSELCSSSWMVALLAFSRTGCHGLHHSCRLPGAGLAQKCAATPW